MTNALNYAALNEGTPVICSLGQDALRHPQHSNGRRTMHTIIKKSDLYYSSSHHRWLSPMELFAIHNYPVQPSLRHFGLQCSFDFSRASKGFPPRRRNAILSQIGNGMALCTESLGFCFAWAVLAKARPATHSGAASLSGGSALVRALSLAQVEGRTASLRVSGKRAAASTISESKEVMDAAMELRAMMHKKARSD